MRIDAKSTLFGHPTTDVRQVLREAHRGCGVSAWYVAKVLQKPDTWHQPDATDPRAHKLLKDLLGAGYLALTQHGGYDTTAKGASLALATAAQPLKRATADRLVAELLERVETINQDDLGEFPYTVQRVTLFGSYLSDRERINDVDVLVDLKRRFCDPELQQRYEEFATAEYGPERWSSLGHELMWPLLRSLKFLKNRSTGLSIHLAESEGLDIYGLSHREIFAGVDSTVDDLDVAQTQVDWVHRNTNMAESAPGYAPFDALVAFACRLTSLRAGVAA